MKKRQGFLHLTLCSAALLASGTPGAATERLYVENTDSGDVTVISVPEHEMIGRIEIGKYPDDVAASHAGDVIYVNRTESAGVPAAPRVGESGDVVAVSTATNEILWRASVPGMPHHMTVSRDDRYVFVPLFDSFFLLVLDAKDGKLVKRIPVGYGPHGTRLSPDGHRLYVGTMFADQMTIVDLDKLEPERAIYFDEGVRPFDITADEKRLYLQLSRRHAFYVVDLTNDKLIQEVPLPKLPEGVTAPKRFPHTVNHGLALAPDDKRLYAAGSIANYVCVYSVPEHELLATIPVGTDPNWIGFSADGRFCYVSNRGSDDISVISTAELREIKRIKAGEYPQRLVTVMLPETKKP